MITVDASVWVSAGVASEPRHTESRQLIRLLEQLGNDRPIIVPIIMRVEIAAAITRSKNDPTLAESYSKLIDRMFSITWIDLDQRICEPARRVAIDHRLRAYDATYAAVALKFQCDLVSLDNDHLKRLGSLVPTFSPLQMIARLTAS